MTRADGGGGVPSAQVANGQSYTDLAGDLAQFMRHSGQKVSLRRKFYILAPWLSNGALGDSVGSEKLHRDLLPGSEMGQMGGAS